MIQNQEIRMAKYVSEEAIRKVFSRYYEELPMMGNTEQMILDECRELNPWMTLEEFLKSGFVGKCWVFWGKHVVETEYYTNGFWYVYRYLDQNTITHVQPIHKPEPPR